MQFFDLRNKFFLFLVFAGMITLILIVLPVVELPLKEYVTSLFSTADGGINQADALTNGKMGKTAFMLVDQILHVVKVILWMALVISIVRFANYLIFSTALRSGEYKISSLLRNVFSIIIYIVAFFVIFNSQYPQIDLAALFTTSTILGVIIGLALQDTLGNLFAGLAIQADQPFQTGDVISIRDKGTGIVENVSWRGVKIRTFQNKLLVISNSVLGKESIEIAPRDNLNARVVNFSTIYESSPTKTIQTIREVVRQIDNVSPKLRPVVRIKDFSLNGIDFEVKYWLEDYSKFNDTDALIRQRIWYAFQREQIEFSTATQIVHIEKKKHESIFLETDDEIHERLTEVSLFAPLTEDETQKLAENSQVRVFAPDEKIVRQGQKGNSMFIIHRGAVTVQAKEDGVLTTLRNLREGDFFGEMGLLTGEPRTATVTATEETEVLEIDNLCLKPILEENPELVKTLSQIIEERRLSLDKMEAENPEHKVHGKESVFNSIKKFFGLKD